MKESRKDNMKMKTLFEFKQSGKSFGEDCITEIKIYEDGSLSYSVIDDNMMENWTKEKPANESLSKQVSDLLQRNQSVFEENDSDCIYIRDEVKKIDYEILLSLRDYEPDRVYRTDSYTD